MKKPSPHQAFALFIILVVVGIACWVGYLDYLAAEIQHPEIWVALLGISYLAHIHLKLSLHGYKDVDHHLWATRIMIIGLSLIPVVMHVPASLAATQQASVITLEVLLPIILLAVIEGLLIVYCFIFLKKRPRR